jgi:hypothetical protein
MSTPDRMPNRLTPIIERVIERSIMGELRWERGAPPDSYAVDVGAIRFRIRTLMGNEDPPYVLELLNSFSPDIITDPTIKPGRAQLIQDLYNAARSNAISNAPDPLLSVEKELGLTAREEDG